ncbi:hypothetical protein PSYMO_38223, partial [Pseudomonas amygdali pv. mori str. 301020]
MLTGDGELAEGSNWEAAIWAGLSERQTGRRLRW